MHSAGKRGKEPDVLGGQEKQSGIIPGRVSSEVLRATSRLTKLRAAVISVLGYTTVYMTEAEGGNWEPK